MDDEQLYSSVVIGYSGVMTSGNLFATPGSSSTASPNLIEFLATGGSDDSDSESYSPPPYDKYLNMEYFYGGVNDDDEYDTDEDEQESMLALKDIFAGDEDKEVITDDEAKEVSAADHEDKEVTAGDDTKEVSVADHEDKEVIADDEAKEVTAGDDVKEVTAGDDTKEVGSPSAADHEAKEVTAGNEVKEVSLAVGNDTERRGEQTGGQVLQKIEEEDILGGIEDDDEHILGGIEDDE